MRSSRHLARAAWIDETRMESASRTGVRLACTTASPRRPPWLCARAIFHARHRSEHPPRFLWQPCPPARLWSSRVSNTTRVARYVLVFPTRLCARVFCASVTPLFSCLTHALRFHLRRLQVSVTNLPTTRRRLKPLLAINELDEAELAALFARTPGLRAASARQLVSERAARGRFCDPGDFDARAASVSYASLASRFELSFSDPQRSSPAPSPARELPARRPRGGPADAPGGGRAAADALVSGLAELSVAAAECDHVVFATFNCCRMSPRAESFESKLVVLERLVKDTPGLSALFLQELFGNAAGRLAMHLRTSTGDQSWTAAGCGSDGSNSVVKHLHAKTHGVSCNAVVYNASALRLVAHTYVSCDETAGPSAAFKRPPHVCVFESVRQSLQAAGKSRSRLLVVANVHILNRDPRRELLHLGDLVSAMRGACARALRQGKSLGLLRKDVVFSVVGDFNRAACRDSPDFRSLHDAGFIELVSSNIASSTVGNAAYPVGEGDSRLTVDFLRETTTAAGSSLDNIFIAREVRDAIRDGWVYQVGGAGRRLGESGRASAGRRRAERSDHLPLIAKLRLESAVDPTPWQCIGDFVVVVNATQ